MKTIKILLPVAAVFISAFAFGQKSNGHQKKGTTVHTSSEVRREQARINGTINANANANERARARANENSVLNESGVYQERRKTKAKSNNGVKRSYARKNQ